MKLLAKFIIRFHKFLHDVRFLFAILVGWILGAFICLSTSPFFYQNLDSYKRVLKWGILFFIAIYISWELYQGCKWLKKWADKHEIENS